MWHTVCLHIWVLLYVSFCCSLSKPQIVRRTGTLVFAQRASKCWSVCECYFKLIQNDTSTSNDKRIRMSTSKICWKARKHIVAWSNSSCTARKNISDRSYWRSKGHPVEFAENGTLSRTLIELDITKRHLITLRDMQEHFLKLWTSLSYLYTFDMTWFLKPLSPSRYGIPHLPVGCGRVVGWWRAP